MRNESEQEDKKLQVLNGVELKRIITAAAQVLDDHKEEVNALNVFPVPDGDTGTNMALTLKAAVRDLDNLETENISKVAATIARGSLMGAEATAVLFCHSISAVLVTDWQTCRQRMVRSLPELLIWQLKQLIKR